jgi:Icc-related predicted phosphoesterase
MRILACGDLHGRRDRIMRVRALVTKHQPDVVVLPGDLTHAGSGPDALDLLALPLPVLAVPGNMDYPPEAARIRTQGKLGEGDPVTIAGVSFGGPEVTRHCDVVVTHDPPYGILDTVPTGRHIGSPHVRDLLDRLRPRLLLCGHAHESPGTERVGDTLVINCTMGDGKTSGALIELTAADLTARLL